MAGVRRVAVLGGAGGIGRDLVARLIGRGDSVTVLDLSASMAAHPVAAGVAAISIDLTDAVSVGAAFDQLAAAGDLDGFVNLAGFVSPVAPLRDVAAPVFDEVIAANLRGAFLAAQRAVPLLTARCGSLVNVASGLAQNVRPGYGPYAMAKAGVIALTKTLALEAAPRVRVNCVAPGAVDTAFLRGGTGRSDEAATPSLDISAYTRVIPLARLANPADVSGPVVFLLSDDSSYITGQTLWINGGAYMP